MAREINERKATDALKEEGKTVDRPEEMENSGQSESRNDDDQDMMRFRSKVARLKEKYGSQKISINEEASTTIEKTDKHAPKDDLKEDDLLERESNALMKDDPVPSDKIKEWKDEVYNLALNLGDQVKRLNLQLKESRKEIRMLRNRHPKKILEELDACRKTIKKIESSNKKEKEELQADLDAANIEVEYLKIQVEALKESCDFTDTQKQSSKEQVDQLKEQIKILSAELDKKDALWRTDAGGKYAVLKHVSDLFIELQKMHIKAKDDIADYEQELCNKIKDTKKQNIKLKRDAMDSLQLAFNIGERAKELSDELEIMRLHQNNQNFSNDYSAKNITVPSEDIRILVQKYSKQKEKIKECEKLKQENQNWKALVAIQDDQTKDLADKLRESRLENENLLSKYQQMSELLKTMAYKQENEIPALIDCDTMTGIRKSMTDKDMTVDPQIQIVPPTFSTDIEVETPRAGHKDDSSRRGFDTKRQDTKLDQYKIIVESGQLILVKQDDTETPDKSSRFMSIDMKKLRKNFLCDASVIEETDDASHNNQFTPKCATPSTHFSGKFFCDADDDFDEEDSLEYRHPAEGKLDYQEEQQHLLPV